MDPYNAYDEDADIAPAIIKHLNILIVFACVVCAAVGLYAVCR